MLENPEQVAEQFDDLGQEHDAASLGMWVFIITEILFFGVLFAAYTIIRILHQEAFAEASGHNNVLLGTIETAVLLTSSLTMALAVHAAQHGRRKNITWFLLATMALGVLFLGIHGFEYYQHYHERLLPGVNFEYPGPKAGGAELFFYLYYVMTGFHMLHVTLGVIELGFIARMAWRGNFTESYYTPVEMSGLYWHFVDIVWIFLFPLFYLVSNI